MNTYDLIKQMDCIKPPAIPRYKDYYKPPYPAGTGVYMLRAGSTMPKGFRFRAGVGHDYNLNADVIESLSVSVSAYTKDGRNVRARIPRELYEAQRGTNEIMAGIYKVGEHKGRKWTITKFYSVWQNGRGECEGAYYEAK